MVFLIQPNVLSLPVPTPKARTQVDLLLCAVVLHAAGLCAHTLPANTLRANLAKAPPRPPWARRTSAVHEVVAEAALLVPFGVAGVMFLQLATGLALAILFPV